MIAPAHPTPFVIVPLDELVAIVDDIITKRLRQQATIAPPVSTQPPKAAFRTRKETAEALGISLTTVNSRLHDGTIPFQRVGRRVLIPESFFTTLEQHTLQAA